MQTDIVKLRHKKKGRVITVDAHDYATDLGKHKYAAYELVGEERRSEANETAPTFSDGGESQSSILDTVSESEAAPEQSDDAKADAKEDEKSSEIDSDELKSEEKPVTIYRGRGRPRKSDSK